MTALLRRSPLGVSYRAKGLSAVLSPAWLLAGASAGSAVYASEFWAYDATGSASVSVRLDAAGGVAVEGGATGTVAVAAVAACDLSLDGSGTGAVTSQASADATLSLEGNVTNTVAVVLSASCPLAYETTGTAKVGVRLNSTTEVTVSGVALCTTAVTATATCTLRSVVAWMRRHVANTAILFSSPTLATTTASPTLAVLALAPTKVLQMSILLKRLDDTIPSFRATLFRDGRVFDLNDPGNQVTGAELRYRRRGDSAWTLRSLTIDPDSTGVVTYDWSPGEPAATGAHEFVVRVAFATGDVQSFPNGDGFPVFFITEGSTL